MPTLTPEAAWAVPLVAGLFETGWAAGLKHTGGFMRLGPSLWTAASMVVSVFLLAKALQVIPVGTAYAVRTGIVGLKLVPPSTP